MLYYETFSVYPLMHFNQIHTTVALLPPQLSRRILRTADIEERSRRAGAYILLEKMLRKHTDDFVRSVQDIVKPEYNSFFEKRGALECVRYDSYGKPYFEGHENAAFNLTHSGYMVGCALITAPEGEISAQVGIDMERVRIDTARAERVAERYFNDEEKALLAPVAADPEAYCRLFTRIWTRKESILKYLGVGLTRISVADSTRPEEHGCFFIEEEKVHTYTDFVDGKPKEELYCLTVCAKIGEKVYSEAAEAEEPAEIEENTVETV
ncbi:MAG: 4'-phosphopantetheinyl transferase superfamily protein [Clostridia bacterium]|nr:4'-phosphopantetheinyl transferase superfamily protein [Clostridia bacterium]